VYSTHSTSFRPRYNSNGARSNITPGRESNKGCPRFPRRGRARQEHEIMTGKERIHAAAVSIALLSAVLHPTLRDPEDDSFPLSTYPMFARNRPRLAKVNAALALGRGGAETALSPLLIGSPETMQAIRILNRSVQAGEKSARALCRAIAARVAKSADPELSAARQIALVSETIDVIEYAGGMRAPRDRRVHSRCRIPRGKP
jgi:hypothetical protein